MELRRYQNEIAQAVMESVLLKRGLTFSVEIARQGGKNEVSAHIGMWLLGWHAACGGTMVKAAPTFDPQAKISIRRLRERLDEWDLHGGYGMEASHIIRMGAARQVFLSAAKEANVVGHTADILLEIDEAQDVAREKYNRDFRPMGSAGNVTTVLYGTPWDEATLLEEVKQHNLELEKGDGVKRHFAFDWEAVAACNPEYRRFVEEERRRLGPNNPLFLTQYCLKLVAGGGRFFSRGQLAQMAGQFGRGKGRTAGKAYVAGIDLAGEGEDSGRDATVVVIGELGESARWPDPTRILRPRNDGLRMETNGGLDSSFRWNDKVGWNDNGVGPGIRIVEHYEWTGTKHPVLYQQLVSIMKSWGCRRIVVDATGVGEGVASFLQHALGSRVVPFKFTAESKSSLGFGLLAAVDSGRLQLHAPDGSADFAEMMRQMELCRPAYRANRTLNFFVDPEEGHDDYVMAVALAVKAAEGGGPRVARGSGG